MRFYKVEQSQADCLDFKEARNAIVQSIIMGRKECN